MTQFAFLWTGVACSGTFSASELLSVQSLNSLRQRHVQADDRDAYKMSKPQFFLFMAFSIACNIFYYIYDFVAYFSETDNLYLKR